MAIIMVQTKESWLAPIGWKGDIEKWGIEHLWDIQGRSIETTGIMLDASI